ncbi:ABCB family ABC transporter ATP-binding protein/permease [Ferrimonas aestuarii]|uniref:ABC transporter ATP-binding protein/permease n=1 Tax=Ferrimonas aestuarii TaxID=2569539 RepID=A0A4V5NWT5_9GAMM|nr:ABC transporter ATP-binding protein/permease [Ferrimonas aestuarii]TKB58298.1 ABC transporter ATP-binding protein/permease [Ferrimonas aestuarii]
MRRHQQATVSYQNVNFGVLKSLIPYLLEFKVILGLSLACLVGAKVASVGLPFILKDIVDTLDGVGDIPAATAIPLALLLAYGLTRFANVLFGELRDTLFGRITERAMRRVGLKVFKHLHRLDLAFHLERRTGGVSRDIERGTNGISFLMRFMVFNIVPTLLEITLVVGLLWWNYHIGFALIVAVAVTAYIGFSVVATEWRTDFVRQVNAAESQSSTRAVDSLLNFETVKYFTNEDHESQHYDKELANWEQARRKNRLSLFALNGGQALIIAVAMTAAMILAASDVVNEQMTLGDFVLINSFMMQVFMPLNFLGFVYREMKGALANIERMFELLDREPLVNDKPEAPALKMNGGTICFDNVAFGYHPQRPILNGVSFEVKPKQKVAIVGASGAGKSTLFKLLFRFYEVSSGEIRIDGQAIDGITQKSLRGAIGVVPQDTVLFNTSIFDNIRYGRVDASDDEVWHAIRLAHLDQFIERLPEKEQTLVGERGLKLSGGEKQRVAIARAILKQPPIMVFDEATSSLDSHSERHILAAMQEIAKEQTTLVIAHRLSTVVDADNIIVLDQGQVVEQGTHEELLEKQGHYSALWLVQQQSQRQSLQRSQRQADDLQNGGEIS